MSEHYTDEDAMAGAAALWADRDEEDDFASLAPSFQSLYVGDARAVLDAVATAIAARAKAEALRELADHMESPEWTHRDDWNVNCAYALEVRARADEIEGR